MAPIPAQAATMLAVDFFHVDCAICHVMRLAHARARGPRPGQPVQHAS